MEVCAEPYNTKVHGLWRRPRKSDGRPGSITEYILQHELPFIPLTDLASKIVLNPACKKANTGITFDPPHNRTTLRGLLTAAGHTVPEVVQGETGDIPGIYLESVREAPAEIEHAAHESLASAI